MKLPRDVDIRSGAFILFAFVVVVTFGGLLVVVVSCRVFGTSCFADNAVAADTVKSMLENIVSILLALMAGTTGRTPPAPAPKPEVNDERV